MPLVVVLGVQVGDEGKGKIVEEESEHADIVARFGGGSGAGHTLVVGDMTVKCRLIPSGILRPYVVNILGNGMVINPEVLLGEMEALEKLMITVSPLRLKISHKAHLVLPGHCALDKAGDKGKIGTTGNGIGPAYSSKMDRRGLRMEDMLDASALYQKVYELESRLQEENEKMNGQSSTLHPYDVANQYFRYARKLAPYIINTSRFLNDRLADGKTVIAEGAQGTLLDIDHGSYPFVTSSTTTIGGVFSGLGVSPRHLTRVIGVAKAFQTRVGNGPFPTEVFGETLNHLRSVGKPWEEKGTVSNRPRRCGWLDINLLRYAAELNGITELALIKMDVLSGLDNVKLCVCYEGEKSAVEYMDLDNCKPFYEDALGWKTDISGVRDYRDLDVNAKHYVRRIENLAGVPVASISVGPARGQTIQKK